MSLLGGARAGEGGGTGRDGGAGLAVGVGTGLPGGAGGADEPALLASRLGIEGGFARLPRAGDFPVLALVIVSYIHIEFTLSSRLQFGHSPCKKSS